MASRETKLLSKFGLELDLISGKVMRRVSINSEFKVRIQFLSATEYFPSRTIIQPGWVSLLSSSLLLSAFSRWDNSGTL